MKRPFYLLTSCTACKTQRFAREDIPAGHLCYQATFFGVYNGVRITKLIVFSPSPIPTNIPQILKLKELDFHDNVLFAYLLKSKRLDIILR
ncbi:MAG: hypothetical protein A2504_06795 [Bdellovibrionales bacterium RIFOXYD12_FULL_39_22]|nr:MAG: hypothetical protein A2385_09115 [Bdellovibrionales bacterium RIFOXYB1_FULL_39_21]OFZ45143.1 MAG: hypothetical protein A2485_05425 [Bdellovibrionales bacterium RIFOXYC12_FULL_39_17]OFZ45665.1 MAG: hypothetical protein A2404_03695 [Bdellovibrionales bacterium RIFOXYC1_FULL_39_130]OFZ71777.1 MAG: hypothetical protein A2451_07010 [Bdellovibrionales bacterium RIFOXYC2_FULL_39_8]OFZ77527.1 MAG: hypothetical protein A2560_09280 [Bdellovibrionales bacterium RIFOXYD1_FULL_39_84]OFZ91656.1 MAG: